MSIAQKLLTIANNTQSVAAAVNSAITPINGRSIVLKNTVADEPVEINLSSKNLLSTLTKWGQTRVNNAEPIYFKQGQTYTFTHNGDYTAERLMFFGTEMDGTPFSDSNGSELGKYISGVYTGGTGRLQSAMDLVTPNKFTFTCNKDCIINAMQFWVTGTENTPFTEFQLEVGKPATEYTPYTTDFSDMEVVATGKNLLPYPYHHPTMTHQGITFTDNGDGTVTANGTATGRANFVLYSNTDTWSGDYALSGCPKGGSSSTYYIQSRNGFKDCGEGFVHKSAHYAEFQRIAIYIEAGVTVENLVFKPQLEIGTAVTEYEPYKGSQTALSNEDGVVRGIAAYSPTTTLFSANEAAILNVKYFAETGENICKLYRALQQKQSALQDYLRGRL